MDEEQSMKWKPAYPWAAADAYMVKQFATALEQCELAMAGLETQAITLREDFRALREKLQNAAQREADLTSGPGRRRIYAPLCLFARGRRGGLEIYWQEVHRKHRTGGVVFRYLRRNKAGDYLMADLLRRAQPFERELVELFEARARKLRAMWRELSKVRRMTRDALRQAERQQQNAANWPENAQEAMGRRQRAA